jgi:hypothetical protein
MEVWMSLSVVAAAALAYFFVAERFHLFHAGPVDRERFRHRRPTFDPATMVVEPDPYAGGLARYTLMGVLGAGLVLASLPGDVVAGVQGIAQPVTAPGYAEKIVIDGTRTSSAAVLFDHDAHVEREGGDASCSRCHHAVRAGERATGCARCHRDMYRPTDTFDHRLHEARLGSKAGCATCHLDDAEKDAAHTKPCLECHTRMFPVNARIQPQHPPRLAAAPGYVPALHGLCIECHRERAQDARLHMPALGECATCHAGEVPAFDPVRPDERQRL